MIKPSDTSPRTTPAPKTTTEASHQATAENGSRTDRRHHNAGTAAAA
jgi:hypothetical protein